jgi:hypothetical protein
MRGLVLAALIFVSTAAPAMADEFIGIFVGASYLSSGVGVKLPAWGFETAGKLEEQWSLGFTVSFLPLGSNVAGASDSGSLTTFMGGVTYHGWPNNRGPWAGVRAGVGVVNNAASVEGLGAFNTGLGASASSNEFTYGIALGYDKELGSEWTWGPQVSYVRVSASGGALSVINALVTLRYWPE